MKNLAAKIALVFVILLQVTIRYSHYWPPLGGTNTSRPEAPHLARLASGQRWQDYVNRGIACVPEWEFGTRVLIDGKEWICVDRGGKIKYNRGAPYVDFLTPNGSHKYGELVDVVLLGPQFEQSHLRY